jgi:hypothetical protein
VKKKKKRKKKKENHGAQILASLSSLRYHAHSTIKYVHLLVTLEAGFVAVKTPAEPQL